MKMIRFLLCTFLICCLQLLSFGQENTQSAGKGNPPGIITPENEVLMLKEAEFDFGKIPQGKPVTHIFEVSNVGSTPLKILNVQASCGTITSGGTAPGFEGVTDAQIRSAPLDLMVKKFSFTRPKLFG